MSDSDFGLFGDDEPVEEQPVTLEDAQSRSGSTALYNVVSILFLLLTVLTIAAVVGIYLNPNAPYNIFPPAGGAAVPTAFVIPTLTATQEGAEDLPPSWTPSPSPTVAGGGAQPAATPTPAVTAAAAPTLTLSGPTAQPGQETLTPAQTPSSFQPTLAAFPFTLQEGVPAFTENPEENGGCEALYIVGQVFDLDEQPIDGLAVWVTGDNFETPDITKFNDRYGPGSYEILVNSAPIEAEFEIQLWTVSAQALSDKTVIRTRATCEENLIFVNFVQNHEY